jgi:mutator protein MutT
MNCDAQLLDRIRSHLRSLDRLTLGGPELRAAAVAVAVAEAGHGADLPDLPRHAQWNEDAALVLTRRSSRLRNHAGQWALPGGRIDAGETPEQAALRELAEEVGLVLDPSAVIGRLDDFVTRSGYVMTPVVVWAGAARAMTPNPDEVASIHRIPVNELMREDAPLLEHLAEHEHPVLRMPIGDDWIAAPTAAILYQFREVCVAGRHTRVSHFEQPKFAWK